MNLKRVIQIKNVPFTPGPVVYWMSRDMRATDNWAAHFAQLLATERNSPLIVIFFCFEEYLGAKNDFFTFMMSGLNETASEFESYSIPFILKKIKTKQDILYSLVELKPSALIVDFDPLRPKIEMKEYVKNRLNADIFEVDAHNIVPCQVCSDKQEYAAYTIRPKIMRLLPEFMDEPAQMTTHVFNNQINIIKIEVSADSLTNLPKAGAIAAKERLQRFIQDKLENYAELRNNPSIDATSGLSPYLHFGQISAQRVAIEVFNSNANERSKAVFLDELIIRRELAENFCFYNKNYDNFDGFNSWAKETLNKHRSDKREYIYSIDDFENANTHDKIWNNAQSEMIRSGKMHSYLRMYWAKKILEWSATPEDAMKTAIYLNNKYELDGRDPNGYAGIAWSIGGVHDRPWFERKVFGKIRYMNENGVKKRMNNKKSRL
jgi:deoxyribodipyrimidine photo-lyase